MRLAPKYKPLNTEYFNPRTPCGVRPAAGSATCGRKIFQSTHPLRGATVEGGITVVESWLFQSTHPLRGATPPRFLSIGGKPFQSTHPLRGATFCDVVSTTGSSFQSTHPLRGATVGLERVVLRRLNFNPRTPCGVRLRRRPNRVLGQKFQSTHPLRGATDAAVKRFREDWISIHAPLAGCDDYSVLHCSDGVISIHAPLAGCDE